MTLRAISFSLFLLVACGGDDDAVDTGSAGDTSTGGDTAADTNAADTNVGDTNVGDTNAADTNAADTNAADTSSGSCVAGAEVVTFTTSDDVTLEADLTLTGDAADPVAILFHMIPPSNTRTNYPAEFIAALTSRGVNVLNVDRRGAGGSSGVAAEAYTGPTAKIDAQAAFDFLAAHSCVNTSRFVLVGASNGTTTALDYTVAAETDDAYPLPSGLVFLTGGGYTESQNRIADHRALLEPLPVTFMWAENEAPANTWATGFQADAPDGWAFLSYAEGDHGTRNFTRAPASVNDVADAIGSALAE